MNSAERLKGCRILVVEDDRVNQILVEDLLSYHGIRVKIAENGREALSLLEEQPFDGILMDCRMPVMDGYETTRTLRKTTRFRSLPIIALTANAMAGDREKALNAGMDDFIAKPIDIDEFYRKIAKWIVPKPPSPSDEQ